MSSLRTRLLAYTAILLVSALTIASMSIYLLMKASLLTEFDAALLLEARSLSAHAEVEDNLISLEFEGAQLPEYDRELHPHYFEFVTREGHTVARSQSLSDRHLAATEAFTIKPAFTAVSLPNGQAGRQVEFRFHPRLKDNEEYSATGDMLRLIVARDTTELDGVLRTLAGLLLAVSVVTVIMGTLLLHPVIGKGLQPIHSLATSIGRVGTKDLSERIQSAGAPSELAPVVERLNDLLGRLDDTLTREKSFTADVAHELRTPLAGLQAALEVCASRTRSPEGYQRVVRECLQVANGMHAMVNSLFLLARADAGHLKINLQSVGISNLIEECWLPFEAAASRKVLVIQWEGMCSEPVEIDSEKARLVIRNMFENAVAYSPRSGWIHVTTNLTEKKLTVSVANNGCVLKQGDANHLFDRFWRGDKARSEAGLHCGLGLSLCQKVIETMGGSIHAHIDGEVFAIEACFPIEAVFANSSQS